MGHSHALPEGIQSLPRVGVPVTPQISPQERIVSVHFGRRLSFDDIKSYAESLWMDPRFDPEFSEIIDLSAVEQIDLSAEQALMLADFIDPFSVSAHRAFVARTEFQVQAVRLHQILREEGVRNIGVFSSFADARKWISDSTANRKRAAGSSLAPEKPRK